MSTLPLNLFACGEPDLGELRPRRTTLDEASWIDVFPAAVAGADSLFTELESRLSWHRKRRLMFGTWYDEPRLSATSPLEGLQLPTVVDQIRHALTSHYQRSFEGLFCNFYRTGQDSVAWHADRIGRTDLDPLVAIISLGGPRTFAIRPMHRGASQRFILHSGDILVMGGATQHHWEHAIPKCHLASPRMSVTMRAGGPPLDHQISAVRRRVTRHQRGPRGPAPTPATNQSPHQ